MYNLDARPELHLHAGLSHLAPFQPASHRHVTVEASSGGSQPFSGCAGSQSEQRPWPLHKAAAHCARSAMHFSNSGPTVDVRKSVMVLLYPLTWASLELPHMNTPSAPIAAGVRTLAESCSSDTGLAPGQSQMYVRMSGRTKGFPAAEAAVSASFTAVMLLLTEAAVEAAVRPYLP